MAAATTAVIFGVTVGPKVYERLFPAPAAPPEAESALLREYLAGKQITVKQENAEPVLGEAKNDAKPTAAADAAEELQPATTLSGALGAATGGLVDEVCDVARQLSLKSEHDQKLEALRASLNKELQRLLSDGSLLGGITAVPKGSNLIQEKLRQAEAGLEAEYQQQLNNLRCS